MLHYFRRKEFLSLTDTIISEYLQLVFSERSLRMFASNYAANIGKFRGHVPELMKITSAVLSFMFSQILCVT